MPSNLSKHAVTNCSSLLTVFCLSQKISPEHVFGDFSLCGTAHLNCCMTPAAASLPAHLLAPITHSWQTQQQHSWWSPSSRSQWSLPGHSQCQAQQQCLEHGAQPTRRIWGGEVKVLCTLVPLYYAKCNKLKHSWWQNICSDCIHVNKAKNTFSGHTILREVRKEIQVCCFFFFTVNTPRR